jgi:hypothetical protein
LNGRRPRDWFKARASRDARTTVDRRIRPAKVLSVRAYRWNLHLVALVAAVCVATSLAVPASGITARTGTQCDEASSRAALGAYLRAFNQGDYATLDVLFAQAPHFRWYSSAPPHGRTGQGTSRDRGTLIRYFRARHAKREKLSLVKFNYASAQDRDGAVVSNFNGDLSRRASDVPARRRGFKASLRCTETERQFIVISIGTPM